MYLLLTLLFGKHLYSWVLCPTEHWISRSKHHGQQMCWKSLVTLFSREYLRMPVHRLPLSCSNRPLSVSRTLSLCVWLSRFPPLSHTSQQTLLCPSSTLRPQHLAKTLCCCRLETLHTSTAPALRSLLPVPGLGSNYSASSSASLART